MFKGNIHNGHRYCFDECICLHEYNDEVTCCQDCSYYKDYHKKQDNSWALPFEVLE